MQVVIPRAREETVAELRRLIPSIMDSQSRHSIFASLNTIIRQSRPERPDTYPSLTSIHDMMDQVQSESTQHFSSIIGHIDRGDLFRSHLRAGTVA